MQVPFPDPGKQTLVASGITWFVERDHLPAIMPLIIPCLYLTAYIETPEPVHIFFADLICCPSLLIIEINIFAIQSRNSGSIFSPFHAPFYFKGIDSGFDQPGQVRDRTQIFQA